jgi:Fe2+ or Zn2+ uptake regulation protein
MLEKKGIRASHQRLMILNYLACNPIHPTADKILFEIKKDLPTLSKSTVYKTLNAFVAAGILREITIEDNEIRYEYNLSDHGHFKCEKCGGIFDFDIDTASFNYSGLNGFKISSKDVFFKGLCKNCFNK